MDKFTPADEAAAERLREAFHFIAGERERHSAEPLGELIERASQRYSLSDTERAWVRWSLDPKSVALANKEPEPG